MSVNFANSKLLLKNMNSEVPLITRGAGIYLYDDKGKDYLDGCAGLFNVSIGHGNQEVIDAISQSLSQLAFVSSNLSSPPSEALALRLSEIDPTLELTRSLFLCSGSEAVEAAIKLARQIWVERGRITKHKIIARFPSYHGNTLFALSASGRPYAKAIFQPLLHEIATTPAPYRYRSPVGDFEAHGPEYFAEQLEQTITKAGAENVAAFIVEPVSVSSAGGEFPPAEYFRALQAICRKHQVLIIADEILCGTGRTGKFFASSHFGLQPDILCLGKGISGGYVPLSVVMTREEHAETIRKGSGSLLHLQTYQQAPCMTAAGLATLAYFEKHQVVENAAHVGKKFKQALIDTFGQHRNVGFVSGNGLLVGLDLVADKSSKKCFDPTLKVAESIFAEALRAGLLLYPIHGHVDGHQGDLLAFAPPLTLKENEIPALVSRTQLVVEQFFRKLPV